MTRQTEKGKIKRKKIYEDLDSLQADLDSWLTTHNNERLIKERCAAAERQCKRYRLGKDNIISAILPVFIDR